MVQGRTGKLAAVALLSGLLFGVVHAAGDARVDGKAATEIAPKPGTPAGGSAAPPVATSYVDLDCGGGRKLRLVGNCSVSDKQKIGICRGVNGATEFDVSCSAGCSGAPPAGMNSCHDIIVR